MYPNIKLLTLIRVFLVLTIPAWIVIADSILLTEKQLQRLAVEYGEQARERLVSWQQLIHQHRNSNVSVKLKVVNQFFNKLEFIDDQKMWGQADYWATPVEFLGRGGGDCEDFSIAKYFTLRELNMPQEQLRLTYVKTRKLQQAHMVVSYYKKPEAEPLILDNLDKKIKPARLRRDLIPAYSFNGDNLWKAKSLSGFGTLVGKTKNLDIWQQLLKKIQRIRE